MLLPLYQINGMEIERDFLVLVPFKIDLIPINLQCFLINQKIMLLVFAQSTRNEIPKWNLNPPCFFSWVNVSLFCPDSDGPAISNLLKPLQSFWYLCQDNSSMNASGECSESHWKFFRDLTYMECNASGRACFVSHPKSRGDPHKWHHQDFVCVFVTQTSLKSN